MRFFIVILIFSICFSITDNIKVNIKKSNLDQLKQKLELTVESEKNVYGLQFKLNYNPSEVSFNSSKCLLDNFIYEFSENNKGTIKGIIFSMHGYPLNPQKCSSLIDFEFRPINTFKGISKVQVSDLIIAGKNGIQLDPYSNIASMNIDIFSSKKTSLNKNYPNPFNPKTKIHYDLEIDNYLKINIYDINGRLMQKLFDNHQIAGSHSIMWDATNFASGTYFVSMNTKNHTFKQKINLIK